jgi:hypothetical protein
MVLNSPPSGENTTLTVLKWQEKEVSDTSVPGTEFEFTLASSRVISQLTGIKATESTPTKFSEDATNGRWEYYKYDSAWVLTKGHRHQRDCDVYFRKNGVDYSVDGASTAITSVKEGTTKIEVTFAQSVTTDEADAIVLSYAYIDATNPVPSKYCIKDYNPKQSGRDYTTINCLGGVTKKRRQPQDLTELSLTLFKTGTGLTSYMLGKRAVLTENSLTVTSTSGGNYVENVAIGVVVTDPDNSKNKIGWIMTNAGATANDHKGGADADLEETISFKSDPEDYAEFEYTTS